jgi:hypothetical protein
VAGAGTEGARLVPTEAPRRPKSNLSATIGPGERNASGGWALALLKTRTMRARFQWGDKEELPQEADAADLPVWSYNVAPHPKRNASSFALLAESSLLVCCEGMEEKFSGIARICLAVGTPHTFKVTMF